MNDIDRQRLQDLPIHMITLLMFCENSSESHAFIAASIREHGKGVRFIEREFADCKRVASILHDMLRASDAKRLQYADIVDKVRESFAQFLLEKHHAEREQLRAAGYKFDAQDKLIARPDNTPL